jgi:spectinomycin phosphotransferase
MLGKPDIPEDLLTDCLRERYDIDARCVEFLPIGNDENSALYRVDANDDRAYFLKLRLGEFDASSATLPKLLSDQGVPGVIAPMENVRGQVWTRADRYNLVLFRFVQGHTAFKVELSERNWHELGKAMRALHDTELPAEMGSALRSETYPARWRDATRALLARDLTPFDAATEETARVLSARRDEILELVGRADELAQVACRDASMYVLCHGDIHGNNVLVDGEGTLFVVDWDTAVLAPKERDLMFIGGGVGGCWNAEHETELFYQGYGAVDIDAATLAYYRYDRVLEDIAVTVDQIFSTDFSEADRTWWASMGERQFDPGQVIDMARRADAAVGLTT